MQESIAAEADRSHPDLAVSGIAITRGRRDILGWPLVGRFLLSGWARMTLQLGMLLLLLIAIVYGFAIPTAADNHVTTGLLWGIFWPFLVIVTLPTLGRVVCTACPHGLIGRLLTPRGLRRKLPRSLRNPYIGLALLMLSYWIPFYAFEPFSSPLPTAILFLAWTILAVAVSCLYDDMAYCKYFCPIGGILSAFSRVSFTWLDSDRGACDGCRSFDCAKACKYRLSPFNFDKRGSMEDCTLCMECAESCTSIRWRLVAPAHGIRRALSRPRRQDVWVYLAMIAVITMSMHFHHGLGHSAIRDQLPWNRLGEAFLVSWPALRDTGFMPGGLLALFTATLVTLAAGLGGLAGAGRVLGMRPDEAFARLGYGLAPLMIVGGLSHVSEFFFLHYAHQISNAFIQILSLPIPFMEPLARHGEPWLRVFSLFKYLAFLFSVSLVWYGLKAVGASGRRFWMAFPLASLMAWVYLASVLFNSYVHAVYGAAHHMR